MNMRLAALCIVAVTGCAGGGYRSQIVPAVPQIADGVPAATQANIVIADQWNNRVVEVDSKHNIVWHFGDGSIVAGPTSVIGPNDAERYGKNLTLIAGSGLPPGTTVKGCAKGCQDNRVIVVNGAGKIVWQYGQAGVPGSTGGLLNVPVGAIHLSNGDVMITAQGNARIIEVTPPKKIAWQFGVTGKPGPGLNQLNNPNSAEVLPNGHILIADENNNRILEVTRAGKVVWSYGTPKDTKLLNVCAFASRLPNGNTLFVDSGNNRVVEINNAKSVVWTYATNKQPGSIPAPQTAHAVRLKNGDTLISNQADNQVIEVTNAGKIVFSQGKIARAGAGFNMLNWPYDAKVIGDFTGLTPP